MKTCHQCGIKIITPCPKNHNLCSNKCRRIWDGIGERRRLIEFVKKVNAGFAYDEVSQLL